MSRILIGIILVLGVALISMVVYCHNLINKLETEVVKNLNLELKLDTQNKELEKIKLETQFYSQEKEKQVQAIKNKYDEVLQKNTQLQKNKVTNSSIQQNNNNDTQQCFKEQKRIKDLERILNALTLLLKERLRG